MVSTRQVLIPLLVLATAASHAITWCHDYSIYRASQYVLGRGFDTNHLAPIALKSRLTGLGYTLVAVSRPGESVALRHGDVVIIGNAAEGQAEDHSGFVSDTSGRIDHLIQKFGDSGHAYTPSEIETVFDPHFNEKLVRKGWTIDDLRNRKRTVNGVESDSIYKNKSFQVYRQTRQMSDQVGVWVSGGPPTPLNPNGLPPDFSVDFRSGNAALAGTKITFDKLPEVIIETEEVQLSLIMRNGAGNAFTEQRVKVAVTGNVKKPKPLHGGLFADPTQYSVEVSLCDPSKALVSFKTPSGQSVKDAPPASGEVRFPWPVFIPSASIEWRDVLFRFSDNAQFRQRYTWSLMKLSDALKLKFSDMS